MKPMIYTSFLVYILTVSLYCQDIDWTSFKTENSQIPFNKIYTMAIDSQDRVWCGNDNSGNFQHLACYNGTNWTNYINNAWINSVCTGPDGKIWASTSNQEIIYLDGTQFKILSCADLNFPWSFPLFADSNNRLWLFSEDKLLHYSNSSWVTFNSSNSPVNNCKINAIDENTAGVWFATNSKGVFVYNDGEWKTYNTSNSALPSDNINGIVSHDNIIWVTTDSNYLANFDGAQWQSKKIETEASYIKLMDIDIYGNFWMISNLGAIKYDGVKVTVFNTLNSPLETNSLLSLKSDRLSNVWIGTWGSGLYKYHILPNGLEEFTEISKPSYIVEPNPANNYATVKFNLDKPSEVKFSLYDCQGKEIDEYRNEYNSAGAQVFQFDTSCITAGVYYLSIQAGTGVSTVKIAVE